MPMINTACHWGDQNEVNKECGSLLATFVSQSKKLRVGIAYVVIDNMGQWKRTKKTHNRVIGYWQQYNQVQCVHKLH